MSEIYLSGCKGWCKGCHSPHTHDFNAGLDLNDKQFRQKLIDDIKSKEKFIDNIVILGGEPLDNPMNELSEFINDLRSELPSRVDFWLYTHFELSIIKERYQEAFLLFNYIKCGKYVEELHSKDGFKDSMTGVTLATSNQYIVKIERENEDGK